MPGGHASELRHGERTSIWLRSFQIGNMLAVSHKESVARNCNLSVPTTSDLQDNVTGDGGYRIRKRSPRSPSLASSFAVQSSQQPQGSVRRDRDSVSA